MRRILLKLTHHGCHSLQRVHTCERTLYRTPCRILSFPVVRFLLCVGDVRVANVRREVRESCILPLSLPYLPSRSALCAVFDPFAIFAAGCFAAAAAAIFSQHT
jgi:hypothetical protein